jgi:uncharacterized protein
MIDQTISQFISKQSCATVCCASNEPYCFSCFYAFDEREGILYFKSAASSTHITLMRKNAVVAGTILPDKLNTLFVKGLQFKGIAIPPEAEQDEKNTSPYYKKNPAALFMPGEIWRIRLLDIKMTDSSTGLMKKYKWSRGLVAK